ncbi:MAG: hypothetical protein AB7D34_10565 [Sulfurimonas sp.]
MLSVVEDGEKIAVSNLPTYSEHANSGWDLNTFISFYFLFHLLECIENWYPKKDFSQYSNFLFSTFEVAVKNGTINISYTPENKSSPLKNNPH